MKSPSLTVVVASLVVSAGTAWSQVTPPRQNPQPPPPLGPLAPGLAPMTNVAPPPLTGRSQIGAMTSNPAMAPATNIPAPVFPGQTPLTNNVLPPRQAPLGTNIQALPPGVGRVGTTGAMGTGVGSSDRNALTPAQRAQINRLANSLNGIKVGSQITIGQQQQLLSILQASAVGTVRPSNQSVATLANHLLAGWPNGMNAQQRSQLSIDLTRILNSGNLSPAETQLVIGDAQRVLQSAGATPQVMLLIKNDLTAIAMETQQNTQGVVPPNTPTSPTLTPPVQQNNVPEIQPDQPVQPPQ